MKSAREKELEIITVTDRFLKILHDLFGFYLDAHEGFFLYRDKMEQTYQFNVPKVVWATKQGTNPDAAFHHVASSQEIIVRNRPEGPNVLKIRNYIIVMIIEHWNCDIRIKLAEIFRLADPKKLESEIMGDLNKIRQDILHNRGKAENSVRNKIIRFKKDDPIEVSHEMFDSIFNNIVKDMDTLCLRHTGKRGYQDHSLNHKFKDWHRKQDKELFIWR